ncbi:hypothetical protein [Saccharopolyspora hattusasensis]|uniref:hypothetical protein n=1 Tax=Saccharopolyspora hattusasensis TaxID=1128679 RepID=UPI003D995518
MTTSNEPRRLRWSVPAADISTNRWLDEQENISRSLQLLIRESIQRDGYIDVVNRPVEQLPRRGRPPQSDGVTQGKEAATGIDPGRVLLDHEESSPIAEESALEADMSPADEESDAPSEATPEPAQHSPRPEKKGVPPGLNAFLT